MHVYLCISARALVLACSVVTARPLHVLRFLLARRWCCYCRFASNFLPDTLPVSLSRSSQSRERSTTPRPLTEPQQQQHQKQQQQQQRHTLTGKKRPRRKKSRRGQDCPVSDRSDRAAVAISPSRPEKHRNSLTAQGDPNTTPLDHCIHPSSSSQTPKPRQHPHKLKSARTSASQFAGSLRVPGARDDSTGGNGSHVFVPAELRGVGTAVGGAGQEKERTLFVAASSVSFHTRAPSFSSREKRRLTNRKSDLRLLDL